MLYAHHSAVLIFFVLNGMFFSLDAGQNANGANSVTLASSRVTNDTDSNQSAQQNQLCKKAHNFTETEIEEMNLIMRFSPIEARIIIEHLKDPKFFPNNSDYRSVVFVGEPGSGKTVMAKAIAYHMALQGWEYKIIPSAYFLGEYRNQTAVKLKNELYAIEASGKPMVLIIDELNQLLENADSKHHDTDATSIALWSFLDRQAGNDQFFFIGTMNRVHKLPKPFKDRILCDYIDFPLLADLVIKKEILRKYLTTESTRLDNEVTDIFLHESLLKMGPCAGRDLKKISSMICRVNTINNKQNASVIKKESITKAIDEYIKRKDAIKYDFIEETDEERQERQHKENMQMQKEHFVQQQFLQAALSANQTTLTASDSQGHYPIGSTISHEGWQQFNNLISDEQRELHVNMMKKTRQREARDAAKKAQEETIRKAKEEEERKKWFWERW